MILHWGILPRLDHWRPEIESRLSSALGAPVHIGEIRVRSGSWVPAFEVDDVQLLGRDGQVALELGRVSAALAPRSLLTLSPRLSQLHLDGVQLDVRRDARGRLVVAGLDLDGNSGAHDPAAADWVFEQHELVVRHGRLRWTDELRDAPPLELQDVDLVLRNGLRQIDWRLDATPPPGWGQRLALRGRFTRPLLARPADWQRWSGTMYADLPLVDLARLRRHVDLPFELDAGRGALRAWLVVDRGSAARATVDAALTEVDLRLQPRLPPLALAQVQGRMSAHRVGAGWSAEVDGLRFVTDDELPWAATQARLTIEREAPGAPPRGGSLSIDQVDLAPLARLAARLPLPAGLHTQLQALAPQGRLHGLTLQWRGAAEAPSAYRLRTRATGLSLEAGPPGPPAHGRPQSPGRPGLRGVSLTLDATESGGQAELSLDHGSLSFPGVFEEPELPVDSLSAELQWVLQASDGPADTPPQVQLAVRNLRLANADLRASLSAEWRTGAGSGSGDGRRFPGRLLLDGRIDSAQAARVARYLPLGLPEGTRRYVEHAIGPGQVSDGVFHVQGDLWHFPYADGSPGQFRVRARVRDLALAYVPDAAGAPSHWPAMQAVAGELEFDRGAMRIRDAQARIGQLGLHDVQGGIADLAHEGVLRLDGQVSGPLAEMLDFVRRSPVGGWLHGGLDRAQANGGAELALGLQIPLGEPRDSHVRGELQLLGNDLRLQPGTPQLAATRARIGFTESGVKVSEGRARVLGGDASFEGGSQADGSLRFSGQGTATAAAVLAARDVDALAPLAMLAGRLQGQAAYRVELAWAQGQPAVTLTSPLSGVSLDLPAPLAKPAGTPWPLRVQSRPLPGGEAADLLQLDLGNVLRLRYERDLSGPAVRVRRGTVVVGAGAEVPATPADGVHAVLAVPQLDLDAWLALDRSVGGARGSAAVPASTSAAPASGGAGATPGATTSAQVPPTAVPAAATTSATGAASAASPDADTGFWPRTVSLRADELTWSRRAWHGVAAQLDWRPTVGDTTWQARWQSQETEGQATWHQPRAARLPGRLEAHMARLHWPQAPTAALPTAAPATSTPPDGLPDVDLTIDDFRWQGKNLGRVGVNAVNRPLVGSPGVREWQLDHLQAETDEASLHASGRWRPGQPVRLDFVLGFKDSGRFAEHMGAGAVLKGGKGELSGQLAWAGSPLEPDLRSLDGAFTVALAEGRFMKAEPGAARLLGVLSLQALPRRLLLDFRDVFQEGFAFDRVAGEVALQRGVARTTDLRIEGVQAVVLIDGQADLVAETQDLHVVAVPEVNAGTASLAYAAINPAIALGTFVAQWLLRDPLAAAGTREFRVTGSWAEPQVERLERALPAASAASSAAPAAGPVPANPP